jgi:hypothetical protein
MSASATAFAGSGHGILTGMRKRPRSTAGDPMTLGNMRANGVRSLDVSCWQCHHRTILRADPWPDDVPVPSFGHTHGVHPMWHYWCRRPAEPAGAARAGDAEGGGAADQRRAFRLQDSRADWHHHGDHRCDGCGEGNEARVTDAA